MFLLDLDTGHLYPVMANGIRKVDPRGFNKGCSLKFRVGSQVQERSEEGWRTYWPKRPGNNNKDGDNSPKTLNDKNIGLLIEKYYFRNNNQSLSL